MSWRLFKKGLTPVISVRYSSSNSLIINKIGAITCVGLNRPDSKNRLNVDLLKKLKKAIESFEKDECSPVAVLYGERGNFSYGYDLTEFNENPKYFSEIEDVALLDTFTSKPIVAAISGFAVGLAFDIALWCDFRIVEETAVMGGYARKFGLGQAVNFANSLANMPQACLKADRAAIISFSKKFSEAHIKDIMEIKGTQKKIAFEEAEKGLYVTKSEDVRKKNS